MMCDENKKFRPMESPAGKSGSQPPSSDTDGFETRELTFAEIQEKMQEAKEKKEAKDREEALKKAQAQPKPRPDQTILFQKPDLPPPPGEKADETDETAETDETVEIKKDPSKTQTLKLNLGHVKSPPSTTTGTNNAPPPPAEKVENEKVEKVEKVEPPANGQGDDETIVLDETLHVTEEDYKTMPIKRVADFSQAIPAPTRKTSTASRVLLIIVVGMLAVLVYVMLRPRPEIPGLTDSDTTTTTAPVKTTTPTAAADVPRNTGAQRGTPENEMPPPPIIALPTNDFMGTAPLQVKETGPVVSEKLDPELAALVHAFKIRAEILFGSNTKTRRGVYTKLVSGTFQGIKVTYVLQRNGDKVIKDMTSITTRSRGYLILKGNLLDRIKRTDYETLKKELTVAGMEWEKTELPEENRVTVLLRVNKLYGKPVLPGFLIGPKGVAGVDLGMPTSKINSVLPKSKYTVVDKRILSDDKYYITYKVLDRRNNPLFFIYEKDGLVSGIQIISPKFKTAMDLGIGSPLAAFGIFYLENVRLTATAAGVPYVFVNNGEGRFYFPAKGFNLKEKTFPPLAKVNVIEIGDIQQLKE